MAKKVKIYLDPVANTMNIWWDHPKKAFTSEEVNSMTSNNVIVKDKKGRPISLEVIGVFPEELNIVKLFKQNYPVIKNNKPFIIEAKSG